MSMTFTSRDGCWLLVAALLAATAAHADEPDKSIFEAGQKALKAKKYSPVAVYSKGDKPGTVSLAEGKIAEAKDAVAVFGGVTLADGKWDLRNGDVFFNVGKSITVKVGDFELKRGDCVLFKDKKFSKLDLKIAAD
jgi:hypothetical protein